MRAIPPKMTPIRPIPHRGRRGWPSDVIAEAQRLYNESPRPTFRQMSEDIEAALGSGNAPAEKTLSQWARSGAIFEESQEAPWTLGHLTPDEDSLVMPVVRWLVKHRINVVAVGKAGFRIGRPDRPLPLTQHQAQWVARIRTIAPELDPEIVHRLAGDAVLGRVHHVAVYLATTPWRDDGRLYTEAFEAGLIGDRLWMIEWA